MEEIAMNELDIADDVYPVDNISVKKQAFKDGIRDGFPIALGYLAVSFSLGITAKNAGLTAF